MKGVQQYLSFRGRSARLPYWRISIALSLLVAALVLLVMFLAQLVGQASGVIFLLIIPLVIASFAVGVRRLHDRNKSGWWLLLFWVAPTMLSLGAENASDPDNAAALGLSLASLVLSVWGLVEIGFLRGTSGPNRFGDDPTTPRPAEVFE